MASPPLLAGAVWAVLGASLAGLFSGRQPAPPESSASESTSLSELKAQLAEQLFCPACECAEIPCPPQPAVFWWAVLFLAGVVCGLLCSLSCCGAAAAGSWLFPRSAAAAGPGRAQIRAIEPRSIVW